MFPISRAPPLGQAPGSHPGREFGGGPATCGHCPVPCGRQGLLPALCQSRRCRAAACHPFSWLSWALRPRLPVLLFSLMWSVSQRLALVFMFTSKANMACHVPGTHGIATWEAGTTKQSVHSFIYRGHMGALVHLLRPAYPESG